MMEDKQKLKFIQKSKLIIEKLRSRDLDFNALFILECFYNQEDRDLFDIFTIPSLKDLNLSISFQDLKKLEYLVEDPNNTSKIMISVKGREFIEELWFGSKGDMEVSNDVQLFFDSPTEKSEIEKFEEWWNTFPRTTAWQSDDGQIKFTGSRILKNVTKAMAMKKYSKLLNQGLKHEELIGALKYEIKLKKLDSIKKNQNQMDFFKGMDSYFNSERYLLFIESYKENPDFVKGEDKVKGKKKHVHDI